MRRAYRLSLRSRRVLRKGLQLGHVLPTVGSSSSWTRPRGRPEVAKTPLRGGPRGPGGQRDLRRRGLVDRAEGWASHVGAGRVAHEFVNSGVGRLWQVDMHASDRFLTEWLE